MSNWIDANKTLPDCGCYGVDVLAQLERPIGNGKLIVIYTFFRGEWISINGSSWPGMPNPAYWQPLPEPKEPLPM